MMVFTTMCNLFLKLIGRGMEGEKYDKILKMVKTKDLSDMYQSNW